MENGSRWKRALASVALLATGLVAIPESAEARDRCDNNRQVRSNNARYRSGNDGYYDNSRYRARRDGRYDARNDPYYRGNSAYRNDPYYNGNDSYYGYSEPRSAGKSAAIIGGGAAAGAAVGAMTGGKKGAIIGGAIGAAGGLIYDRKTRNDSNRRW